MTTGAADAPKPKQAAQMATLFYAAHLLTVLFWLQDRSEGQQKTRELITFSSEMIGRLRPVLGLPLVAKSLARLAEIVAPMFGPSGAESVTARFARVFSNGVKRSMRKAAKAIARRCPVRPLRLDGSADGGSPGRQVRLQDRARRSPPGRCPARKSNNAAPSGSQTSL